MSSGFCALTNPRDAVLFNADSFDLSDIPTHSDIVRMLMVQNTSRHDTIAYQWKNYDLPDTLCVHVFPPRGTLRSKEIQSIRVEIRTKGHPCEINLDISCEFINLTERREYKKDILRHEILQKELKGQFTITDKRFVTPKAKMTLSEEPVKFNKVLPIHCCIINFLGEDSEMRLSECLKHSPSNEIYFENGLCVGSNPKQKLTPSVSILEDIMWSISNSKMFGNSIEKIFKPHINVTCRQFLMTLADRNKFSQKLCATPRKKLVAAVLEKMLFAIMHQEFVLDTMHLVDQTDIRHISYVQKLPPAYFYRKGNDANYAMKNFLRINSTRLRVSFHERM